MKDTYMAKAGEVEKKWYVVDATDQTLGRLAAEIAKILRGKNKPVYTPHMDAGDYVIVINAEKVSLTGKKLKNKVYFHHTGYNGGGKYATAGEWLKKFPERVIEHAVKGMLPKNKLGADLFRKLHVFAGDKHPYEAQKPEEIKFDIR